MSRSPDDPVLDALDDLLQVLKENSERARLAEERAKTIRELRSENHLYSELIPLEERPLIVELIAQNLSALAEASSRFRKAEAQALRAEGMTLTEIADLFGVSRQRVAELVQPPPGDNGSGGEIRATGRGVWLLGTQILTAWAESGGAGI